jgi:hypothetical protein
MATERQVGRKTGKGTAFVSDRENASSGEILHELFGSPQRIQLLNSK